MDGFLAWDSEGFCWYYSYKPTRQQMLNGRGCKSPNGIIYYPSPMHRYNFVFVGKMVDMTSSKAKKLLEFLDSVERL